MNFKILGFVITATLISGICFAADNPVVTTPPSDQERIDSLIEQNQVLTETIASLKIESARPKTKEEVFAACMQAAQGSHSAMAAESIGSHCDQLLKK